MKVIVTCEHGGNTVPFRFKNLFAGKERLLNSHRGYDRYALVTARGLARRVGTPLVYSTITRLLVDLNRSPHHPKLFSTISRTLGSKERTLIYERYYLPYRREVESTVNKMVKKGRKVLHISVHSFAPVMDGQKKYADIGLLYDPARFPEKKLCLQWQKYIRDADLMLKVRRNYPYLGKADGLVTFLRRRFSQNQYVGVELELNQKIMSREKRQIIVTGILVTTLQSVIDVMSATT